MDGWNSKKYANKTQMEGDDEDAKKPQAALAAAISSSAYKTICLRRGI